MNENIVLAITMGILAGLAGFLVWIHGRVKREQFRKRKITQQFGCIPDMERENVLKKF